MSLDGINLQGHALKVRRPKDYVPTAGEEHIADPTVPNSDGCKYLPYKETLNRRALRVKSVTHNNFFFLVICLTDSNARSIYSHRTCYEHR